MAEVNPNVPQVTDPELEASLTRLLTVVGPLGKLNVLDTVVPTVNLGDVTPASTIVTVRPPSFRSQDIFSAGVLVAPVINTVLADTGALAAGTYDVMFSAAGNNSLIDNNGAQFQHRDAANAANLAFWDHMIMTQSLNDLLHLIPFYSFGYEVALNERLRAVNPIAWPGGNRVHAVIFARLRT